MPDLTDFLIPFRSKGGLPTPSGRRLSDSRFWVSEFGKSSGYGALRASALRTLGNQTSGQVPTPKLGLETPLYEARWGYQCRVPLKYWTELMFLYRGFQLSKLFCYFCDSRCEGLTFLLAFLSSGRASILSLRLWGENARNVWRA
jgi:hypothetical protein